MGFASYHSGLFWPATKDFAKITLVDTYHFPDARHQAMFERLGDEFDNAAAVYVEAGPQEEERLTKALNEDPSLMVSKTGPTLPERLNEQEWEILSRAIAAPCEALRFLPLGRHGRAVWGSSGPPAAQMETHLRAVHDGAVEARQHLARIADWAAQATRAMAPIRSGNPAK